MGWTAPRTWTTGETVTKTIMDTHVKDNLTYLKTEADRLAVTRSDVSGSRAFDTVYTNSTKTRLIVVTIAAGDGSSFAAFSDTNADPTTYVARFTVPTGSTGTVFTLTFPVISSHKYKITDTGTTASIAEWHEYDL